MFTALIKATRVGEKITVILLGNRARNLTEFELIHENHQMVGLDD